MTVATIEAPTTESVVERVWTPGWDRCDRDGAEAFASFTKDGKELLFCNHHKKRFEDALVTSGWSLQMNPLWEEIVNIKPSV